MCCSLRQHLNQMDQALLVSCGVFVGPVRPFIQRLADVITERSKIGGDNAG